MTSEKWEKPIGEKDIYIYIYIYRILTCIIYIVLPVDFLVSCKFVKTNMISLHHSLVFDSSRRRITFCMIERSAQSIYVYDYFTKAILLISWNMKTKIACMKSYILYVVSKQLNFFALRTLPPITSRLHK